MSAGDTVHVQTVPFGTVLTARSSSHVGITARDVKPKARSRGRIARADDPDVNGGGEVEMRVRGGYVPGRQQRSTIHVFPSTITSQADFEGLNSLMVIIMDYFKSSQLILTGRINYTGRMVSRRGVANIVSDAIPNLTSSEQCRHPQSQSATRPFLRFFRMRNPRAGPGPSLSLVCPMPGRESVQQCPPPGQRRAHRHFLLVDSPDRPPEARANSKPSHGSETRSSALAGCRPRLHPSVR